MAWGNAMIISVEGRFFQSTEGCPELIWGDYVGKRVGDDLLLGQILTRFFFYGRTGRLPREDRFVALEGLRIKTWRPES